MRFVICTRSERIPGEGAAERGGRRRIVALRCGTVSPERRGSSQRGEGRERAGFGGRLRTRGGVRSTGGSGVERKTGKAGRCLLALPGPPPSSGETPGALSLVLEPARPLPCSSCDGHWRSPGTAADSQARLEHVF